MKDTTTLFISVTLTSDLLLFIMILKTECPLGGKFKKAMPSQ